MSKKIIIKQIPSIYNDSIQLSYIKNYCNLLEQLNIVLHDSIPDYMSPICHFGAIDDDKNILILFVDNQQIFYYIRNISQDILYNLNKKGFFYDGILIKIKHKQIVRTKKHHTKISIDTYSRLERFAGFINKPELLIHHNNEEVDEIDI
jgi:hypothetical protein